MTRIRKCLELRNPEAWPLVSFILNIDAFNDSTGCAMVNKDMPLSQIPIQYPV